MSGPSSFLFHDYETFGVHPGKDRPCQFAAIRTDAELNPIGKPMEWFCQPANDYIPHPMACLVTGITPQQAKAKGMIEADFIALINQAFMQPGTCGVGYNSIRFDDEVTRHTLFRNFQDPYAREWQNGNSRWDLIDLVRACYALRPEGIVWPEDDNGLPSFRLELLTKANELSHANAHDAVSDVLATIEMAKLVKQQQAKLFDFGLQLRDKRVVAKQFNLLEPKPIVHVSGMFGAAQGCVSWVLPVAWHPSNKNAMIAIDLNKDPEPLLSLDANQIHQRMYTAHSELGPDELPIPVKLIHSNKSPFVAPAASLGAERAEQLGVSRQQCRDSLNQLSANLVEVREKLLEVFNIEREFAVSDDPDTSLYQGFIGNADRQMMQVLKSSDPSALSKAQFHFEDERLNRLLLPYKARNYPEYLNEEELRQWQAIRAVKLEQQAAKVLPEIEALSHEYSQQPEKLQLLQQLYHYIETL